MAFALDDDGQQALALGLASLHDADDLIRRMKSCGYPCEAQERLAAALRQRLEKVRHEFGTKRKE